MRKRPPPHLGISDHPDRGGSAQGVRCDLDTGAACEPERSNAGASAGALAGRDDQDLHQLPLVRSCWVRHTGRLQASQFA